MQLPHPTTTDPPRALDPIGADPPGPVGRAGQLHRWTDLTFLHWPLPPELVQATLPAGLHVDRAGDAAWIGLVLFHLDIRVPGVPYVPWAGCFAETNVRTYVHADDGTRGIWFFSLDAARLGAAALARATWSLPYTWSRMRLTHDGPRVTYECRRRWPHAAGGPRSRVVVEVGDPCAPDELDDLDHFLTARWTLFSTRRGALVRTRAEHPAWPLRRARALEVDDQLVDAAGFSVPPLPPRARYSDGVEVRLGRRHAVAG